LPLSDTDHFARGEIRLGDAWAPIEKVFKDYKAAQADAAAQKARIDDARSRQSATQLQLNTATSDATARERPFQQDLAKNKARQTELQKIIDTKPPVPPKLLPVPAMPPRPATSGYTGGGYGGGYGGYGGTGTTTDPNMTRYNAIVQQIQQIQAQNTRLTSQYQQVLANQKKQQADARKEMVTVSTAVKQGDTDVQKMDGDLQTQAAPLQDKVKAASEVTAGLLREAYVIDMRIKAMGDAMHNAPESLRFKYGIIEWQNAFNALADLEKLLNDTQAEIDRIYQKMKAEGEASRQTLPAGWRHPQQDQMDALKALIARAKASQAAQTGH
jgi:predicted  nucleic acid-binding Zn-ribbon protein